jgi:hypothetical protein
MQHLTEISDVLISAPSQAVISNAQFLKFYAKNRKWNVKDEECNFCYE